MFPLNKPEFSLLQRSLDASNLRQKVIANNIANVDTPFFKRSDVVFEQLLEQQMSASMPGLEGKRTDPRHFRIGGGQPAGIDPQVKVDDSTAINNNMNNVDIDYEMTLLAKNQLRFNTLVGQINHEFRSMRTAIDRR
jgi:flagellar basal-body rod protein FlgB